MNEHKKMTNKKKRKIIIISFNINSFFFLQSKITSPFSFQKKKVYQSSRAFSKKNFYRLFKPQTYMWSIKKKKATEFFFLLFFKITKKKKKKLFLMSF